MDSFSNQITGAWGLVFGSDPVAFALGVVRRAQSSFIVLNNRMVARAGKNRWPFQAPDGTQQDINLQSYPGEQPIATATKLIAWATVYPGGLLDEGQRMAYGYGVGQALEGNHPDDYGPPAPAGSIVTGEGVTVVPPGESASDGVASTALLTGGLQILVQIAPMIFSMLADMARGLMDVPKPPVDQTQTSGDDGASIPLLPLALAGVGAWLAFK